ncbi:MAG: helix-turn-helix domain-containing protein [Candidatus Brocadiae bacterium]|nr:helix-turn-helix domain-containing protein [Candidatus Brocadiia bacterium]
MRESECSRRGSHDDAVLLGVEGVAEMLQCSPHTVRRLANSGRMPRPVKLGRLARWRRSELEEWIAHGCPPWVARVTDEH